MSAYFRVLSPCRQVTWGGRLFRNMVQEIHEMIGMSRGILVIYNQHLLAHHFWVRNLGTACWIPLTQGLSQAVIKVLTRAAVTSRLDVGCVSLQAHAHGYCHISVLAVDRNKFLDTWAFSWSFSQCRIWNLFIN